MKINNYKEFWSFYLNQHSKKTTRRWHFFGTLCVFLCVVLAIFLSNFWFLLMAPVIAYGLAWYSHFFVEGNKPASFGHPLWSLRADFQMFFLMLVNRLDKKESR
ncbi:hypothetical protein SAMN04487897_103327 [Paenibacillus sp. yr247]|uniref:DUF962 domain-containing protein n=1 Tax=Paenibacillus sp. yr247 TaxID=1761880 RepID=UPI0008897898|nr:DUF962 domain-containing protein [Paenibacillus sp. yr247]SDN60868.1 hypothetical protein SAMN04487897_103327 [Paenibacillus sp. yr247]